MKNLGNLSPAKGSNHKTKRLGRGVGSGQGKTAGKGHKGQKARAHPRLGFGFEGGQTPLYRRLPKHGFTNRSNMVKYHLVNLGDLNCFQDGEAVTPATLVEKGVLKKLKHRVKVLGNGTIERRIKVSGLKLTQSVQEMIQKVGGSVE